MTLENKLKFGKADAGKTGLDGMNVSRTSSSGMSAVKANSGSMNARQIDNGLSAAQVAEARRLHGENSLTKKKRRGFAKSLLLNFGDPMIKILLIAFCINLIFLFSHSAWFETIGIVSAILIAVVVSTVSEYGSESAFEKLQQGAMNIGCRVRRDGATVVLPVTQLVVGDIVLLGAGDKIPADGIIVRGKLQVDQSVLNGESKEAKKSAELGGGMNSMSGMNSAGGTGGGQKDDFLNPKQLFSGTVVNGGEAAMLVTAVGDSTFYGRLAGEIQEETPQSPLKLRLEALAKKISLFGYIGAALVALSYLFNALVIQNNFDIARVSAALKDFPALFSHLLSAGTLAVTVIVMAVPEGLPMMITVVLSANMRRMLRDNVLVRRLSGIETAGSMNILFTDKTGTLTRGKPEVETVITGDGEIHKKEKFFAAGAYSEILALSLACNCGAEISGGRAVGGNATDRALLEFAVKIPESGCAAAGKSNQVPFTSDNKFMSVTATGRGFLGKGTTLTKGAPEKLLPACSAYYDQNGNVAPLRNPQKLWRVIEQLNQKSVRVIAAVTSDTPQSSDGQIRGNLVLVGLVGIRDRVRPEAEKGVKQVQSAGIQTVMITGDSKATATAIAAETGIISAQNQLILTSDELAAMSDDQLRKILPDLRVVARALPSDKSRLVRIAQSLNLVVGMTGDGVNDAPALKKADIGFAMGSGTEVAKEAGDVVILDDNIQSISRAVCYGRTIFKSIRKFIIFQLSINFCAIAVSIIAPLLNVEMPITVIQMLWINLVMDTLAGLAFGGERPRNSYMNEPPKRRDEQVINKYMWQQIITASIYTAIISLWFLKSKFINNAFAGKNAGYGMTAFFTLFMFAAIFNSLNARTHKLNLGDYLALNKQFMWIMGLISLIQIALVYLGGAIFRTVPLAPMHLLLIVALSFTVVPLDMIRKLIMQKSGRQCGT